MCDVGTFRVVAQTDLVSRQFDGHPFAARQGIAQAEQRGWIVRQPAPGPTGRPYTVIVATPAGAARAAVLWARAGRADQRVFSGAVKAADVDTKSRCYRAAGAAQARIEAAGGRVARIRIDAELKGQIGRPDGACTTGGGPRGGGGGTAASRGGTALARRARQGALSGRTD